MWVDTSAIAVSAASIGHENALPATPATRTTRRQLRQQAPSVTPTSITVCTLDVAPLFMVRSFRGIWSCGLRLCEPDGIKITHMLPLFRQVLPSQVHQMPARRHPS